MNEALELTNSAGRFFVQFMSAMLWQSSLFILVLFCADGIFGRRFPPAFRYGLWLLVLVKLVLPTSLASPLSPVYWFYPIRSEPSTANTRVERARVRHAAATSVFSSCESAGVPSVSPQRERPTRSLAPSTSPPWAPSETVSAARKLSWEGLIFVAWLFGFATLSFVMTRRLCEVRAILRRSREAAADMAEVFESCRSALGAGASVDLRVSPEVTGPALCGLTRPVVLVSDDLRRLSRSQLRTILLHELFHVKRGDLWVSALQSVLAAAYFFHPLVWFANARICRIREQAVDNAVLVALGEGRRDEYVDTLIAVAKLVRDRPAFGLSLLGVLSKNTLRERIQAMLSRPVPRSATIGGIGVLLLCLMGSVFLPMARGAAAVPQENVEDEQSDRMRALQARMRELERELKGLDRELRALREDGRRGARRERARRRHPEPAPPIPSREPKLPRGEGEPPRFPGLPPLPGVDLSGALSPILNDLLPGVVGEAHELKALKEETLALTEELRGEERNLDRLRERGAASDSIQEAEDKLAALRKHLEAAEHRLEDRAARFEKQMEDWGERYGRRMERWGERFGEDYGKEWERWADQYGKEMEQWAERYEEQWARWAQQYEEQWERWAEQFEKQMKGFEKKMNSRQRGERLR